MLSTKIILVILYQAGKENKIIGSEPQGVNVA